MVLTYRITQAWKWVKGLLGIKPKQVNCEKEGKIKSCRYLGAGNWEYSDVE